MAKTPRISREQLGNLFSLALSDHGFNRQRAEIHLAVGVIWRMMGDQWCKDFLFPGAKNANILTITNVIDDAEMTRQLRILDLSEMLFNLQQIPGFDDCVSRLRAGDIESTLAELDLGRFLHLHSVKFRFVIPISKKGSDYDVEITYPSGIKVCGDAKCKFEGVDFDERNIFNSLETARKQFPKTQPGIIFVKHPSKWAEEHGEELYQVTKRFFRQTQRIVSVKFYVQPFERRGDKIVHRHGYLEYSNPTTRFGNNVDWDLFPVGFLKDFEVPAHWQKIAGISGIGA